MVTHYYVDHINGDNLNTGLSWAEAKFTIGAAVSLITGSDVIHIRNGTAGHEFTEIVSITSISQGGTEAEPTTFITEDQSIIDGANTRNYGFYITHANWVKIKGFTGKDGKISNIKYETSAMNGIVEDIISQGSVYAIRCYPSATFHSVKNCRISGASTGGLWLSPGNDAEICGNIISSCANGMYCYGFNINVHNNEIYGCTTRGMYLYSASNIEVTENYLHNNAIGLYVASASGHIHFNDIHDNTVDAQDNGGAGSLNWDKNSKGNYWGYGGVAYDSDGDAIGDVPEDIAGTAGSQDNYPLMCSYTIWPNCPYLGGGAKKHCWHRIGLNMRRF